MDGKKAHTSRNKRRRVLPGDNFLSLAEMYIQSFYPHSQRLDPKDNTLFVLRALAYTENIIFLPLSVSTTKILQAEIKSDILKLEKVKHHSCNLYYFMDGGLRLSETELLRMAMKLSSNGYRVTILNERTLIEKLITSERPPTYLNKNELSSYYNTLYNAPLIENNLLEEIFAFINSSLKDKVKPELLKEKLLHLKPKINENFVSQNYRDVLTTFDSLWANKEYVEFFIKQNYNRYKLQLYALLDMIRNYFRSMALNKKKQIEFPVNDPAVFDDLAKIIIPPEKHSDPRYFAAGKAIILFFFEYCDFGKKSKEDPPSLFPTTN